MKNKKINLFLLTYVAIGISFINAKPTNFLAYYYDEDDREVLTSGKLIVDYSEIDKSVQSYKAKASQALKNFICSVKNYPNHKNEQCYKKLIDTLTAQNKAKNLKTLEQYIELFSDDEDESINENNKILGVISSRNEEVFILKDSNDSIYGIPFTLINQKYTFVVNEVKKMPNMVISSFMNKDDEEVVKIPPPPSQTKGYVPYKIGDKSFKGALIGKIKKLPNLETNNNKKEDPIVNLFSKGKMYVQQGKFAKIASLYTETSQEAINNALQDSEAVYRTTAETILKQNFSNLRFILDFDPIYVLATESGGNVNDGKLNKHLLFVMRTQEKTYKFTSYNYDNDFSEFLRNNIEQLY